MDSAAQWSNSVAGGCLEMVWEQLLRSAPAPGCGLHGGSEGFKPPEKICKDTNWGFRGFEQTRSLIWETQPLENWWSRKRNKNCVILRVYVAWQWDRRHMVRVGCWSFSVSLKTVYNGAISGHNPTAALIILTFPGLSVRETLQHFNCLVIPVIWSLSLLSRWSQSAGRAALYHSQRGSLFSGRGRVLAWPPPGPRPPLWLISALKGIGLISHQRCQARARWQETREKLQSSKESKRQRGFHLNIVVMRIEIFLEIVHRMKVNVVQPTKKIEYWIFLCPFLFKKAN